MTPQQEIQNLKSRVNELESKLNKFIYPDRYQFERTIKHSGRQLGFFNVLAIPQWASGTGRQDISGDTGIAAKRGTTYNGNVGTTYYSIGDVIAALKSYGLLL